MIVTTKLNKHYKYCNKVTSEAGEWIMFEDSIIEHLFIENNRLQKQYIEFMPSSTILHTICKFQNLQLSSFLQRSYPTIVSTNIIHLPPIVVNFQACSDKRNAVNEARKQGPLQRIAKAMKKSQTREYLESIRIKKSQKKQMVEKEEFEMKIVVDGINRKQLVLWYVETMVYIRFFF